MEKEAFFTGYCRQADQSRMVCAVTEDGQLVEADCLYADCPYGPECTIHQKIEELIKD